MVRLGDVCTIVSGTTPKSNCPEYWDGNINWVTPAELNDDSDVIYESQRKITEQAVQDSSLKPFPAGTVLLSSRAPIGKVAIAGVEMYCNQGFKNLICSNRIYNRYLYHFLKNSTEYLNSLGRGATFKEISKSIVENIEIPLPTLDEQCRIAAVLDKVSGLIAKRREQLDKLDELVKARFVEMFGDLKSNPHGWDTFLFGEYFDITSSKRILKSEWKSKGIPFLRVRDIVQIATTGKMDNEFFVSEKFYAALSDSDGVPKQGDILVSATSTLGKCHVVNPGERFYFKDADVLRFRATKSINPVFFMEQMKTDYIKEQIDRTLGITTVPHFTIKAAKTISMRCPDINLQNEFATFVTRTDKSKLTIQQSLGKLEVLKKALMQQYFE